MCLQILDAGHCIAARNIINSKSANDVSNFACCGAKCDLESLNECGSIVFLISSEIVDLKVFAWRRSGIDGTAFA